MIEAELITLPLLVGVTVVLAEITSMNAIGWLGLFLAGVGLGGIYFGGLWFTLRRLNRWRQPFLGMGISWLVRLVFLLSGGAWLMKQTMASPLPLILLLSAGMWVSRTLLIASLLATVERSVAVKANSSLLSDS